MISQWVSLAFCSRALNTCAGGRVCVAIYGKWSGFNLWSCLAHDLLVKIGFGLWTRRDVWQLAHYLNLSLHCVMEFFFSFSGQLRLVSLAFLGLAEWPVFQNVMLTNLKEILHSQAYKISFSSFLWKTAVASCLSVALGKACARNKLPDSYQQDYRTRWVTAMMSSRCLWNAAFKLVFFT